MLIAGCALAALGILLGAFGAHALRSALGATQLGWWQTGIDYQMWNAVGLVALSAAPIARLKVPAVLIGAGTIVFAGSLYVMALTDMRWLGMVTPLGGLLMIGGWIAAAWAARSAN